MVNGISNLPSVNVGYANTSSNSSSVAFRGDQSSDDFVSSQGSEKKKSGLVKGLVIAAGIAAAVIFRKNIGSAVEKVAPKLGNFIKGGKNAIDNVAAGAAKLAKNSFKELDDGVKTAEEALSKIKSGKALNVDIKAAEEAVKVAKEAVEHQHTAYMNTIQDAMLALRKGEAQGVKGEAKKVLLDGVNAAKAEYKAALKESGMKAKDIGTHISTAMTGIDKNVAAELKSYDGFAKIISDFQKGVLKGTKPGTGIFQDARMNRINWLTDGGMTKETAAKQVDTEIRAVITQVKEAATKTKK